MGLEDLPQRIQDKIVNDVKERRFKTGPDNEIHCTELVGCLRESYFKRKYPEQMKEEVSSLYFFWRGQLFDGEWTPLFDRNQNKVTHRIWGELVTIVGTYDFIDEDEAVADLKTTGAVYRVVKAGQAKKGHDSQVKFYAWCMAKTAARVYYVDLMTACKMEVEIGTIAEQQHFIRDMEKRCMILYDALKNYVVPKKEKEYTKSHWKCRDYCDFKERCYGGEDDT